jgi:hypothetical protein
LIEFQSAEFLPPAVVGLCGDLGFFAGLRCGFTVGIAWGKPSNWAEEPVALYSLRGDED